MIALALLCCAASPAQDAAVIEAELPQLRLEELGRWREHVLPAEAEVAFERLPWHASFAEGLRAAQEQARPLLLWAMNGHPLGCT